MEDRLTRTPGSADELQLQILGQIRDSLSMQGRLLTEQSKAIGEMNGRLIRVEERDSRIAELQDAYKALDGKVDVLMRDKDERAGAGRVFVGIRGWIPVVIAIVSAIASIFTALYLSGRAAGVVGAPPNRALERAIGEVERHADAPSVERR